MALVEVELTVSSDPLPDATAWLIADAQQRVEAFSDEHAVSIPAYVPSDFEVVYRGLAAIELQRLATGRRFIEWGSGIGVITCLAESLGFDAVGIEIEPRLVEMAEELAEEHGASVQFARGSYVPHGAEPRLEMPDDVAWLASGGPDGYEELDMEPDDFDVVFAYPWPGEEQVIFDLFAGSAAVGALLLTYHGQDGLKLHRKVGR
jgi:hypothetical protein